jgi:hypothetical protein
LEANVSSDYPARTVILSSGDGAVDVLFEMVGPVVSIAPFSHLRLVLNGPESATLTIGHGPNGVSIFRDQGLEVRAFAQDGEQIDLSTFTG